MKTLLLTVASGALLALSLPAYDLEWMAWVAVVPVLLAAQGRRPLEAVGLSILASALCGAIHTGWSANPLLLLAGYLPFLWLALLVGTVVTLGTVARQRLHLSGLHWVVVCACAGVAAEWVTTLSPLPLYLGVLQYRNLPLLQVASFTGIWGVSWLLWWVNAAVADAVLRHSVRTRCLAGTAVMLLCTFGWGEWRLMRTQGAGHTTLRVAAIQDYGGVSREDLTRGAVRRGARLVVWSEECLGDSFAPQSPDDPARTLARALRTSLVVGYSEQAEPKPYNCVALVAADGQVRGVHRKIHLFSDERQLVQPGHAATSFPTALANIGLEICYDNCFTDVTRRVAAASAQVIAVPNYDPPTPHDVLHRLHSTLLPFRAVENAVPMIRCDSNGLCQIVNLDGRIVGQVPMATAEALVGDVWLGDGHGTLFTRYGDWFASACWVVLLLEVTVAALRKRTPPPHESNGGIGPNAPIAE